MKTQTTKFSPSCLLENYSWCIKDRISIGYTKRDKGFTDITYQAIKKARRVLVSYFALGGRLPVLRAILVPDRREYDRLVKELLRVDIEVPSKPNRIAQTQRTDLLILSPRAYKRDSIYKYAPAEFERLLYHETVHVFEEFLSPNIEAVPRWWSEGLAVYLSHQWQYEDEFRNSVLQKTKKGSIPSVKQIERSVKLAYEWGWTIVCCIEYNYGKDAVIKVVKGCLNGDVLRMIGEEAKNFEEKWKRWLIGVLVSRL